MRRGAGVIGLLAAEGCLGFSLGAGCPSERRVGGFVEPPADRTVVTDPVSGRSCEKGSTTQAAVFENRTFYFCDNDSPMRFREEPARYVGP